MVIDDDFIVNLVERNTFNDDFILQFDFFLKKHTFLLFGYNFCIL